MEKAGGTTDCSTSGEYLQKSEQMKSDAASFFSSIIHFLLHIFSDRVSALQVARVGLLKLHFETFCL